MKYNKKFKIKTLEGEVHNCCINSSYQKQDKKILKTKTF